MTKRIVDFRPPRIALLMLLLPGVVHWLVPGLALISPAIIAGGIICLAGFTLMMWAWWQFQVADTAVCPTEPDSTLVLMR